MNEHSPKKHGSGKLVRTGMSQVLSIPADLELPGTYVEITSEDGRLIIEPVTMTRERFEALLDSLEPGTDFPHVPRRGPPPPPVDLE